MTIEHSLIADGQRHEPKHASTAPANTVNKANGDGTTQYAFVNYSELLGKPSSQAYTQVLYGVSSATSQQPSATNTALQIEFGNAQTLADVSISSPGVLTFNTPGFYLVSLFLQFGRTDATGNAILFHRMLVNGSQYLNSNVMSLSAAAQTHAYHTSIPMQRTAGDTLLFQIIRDSTGTNAGGLFSTTTSTSGWNSGPTAAILVHKFQGLV